MKTSLLFPLFAVAVVSALPLASLHAAANASDNAGNTVYNNGYSGVNGGTGFGSNVVVTADTNGNTSSFVQSAAINGNGTSGGGIDTSGRSFGLYASNSASITDTRTFTTGLSGNANLNVGQTFSLGFDNGFINTGSSVGFSLQNTTTTQFTFGFVGGNADYFYSIAGGTGVDTGVGYTDGGLTLSFAKTSATAFTLKITPLNTGTTTTITGTLAATANISQFQVFNNNATGTNTSTGSNYNLYFNSPTITGDTAAPEPGTWVMLLAGIGLLACVQRFRRRRA